MPSANNNEPLHTPESPLFELRRSRIQGTGAFALTRIPKGTRIIEYTGEKISNSEADRRYDDDTMSRHHTFLFTLSSRTVVDAAVGGNEARFINHSCAPNCEAVIERGRIFIESIREIPLGAELAYDYAYERSEDHTEDDESLYACRCGAAACRGTILAPPARKGKRPARSRKKSARKTGAKKQAAKRAPAVKRRRQHTTRTRLRKQRSAR
ncbi:MAG TPA: SET domain-containing protein-lysine N-methyltransferase [Gemmatimonadaceae bacterium]|nr:SET domain-containing protein-lysine N-methyltransferase [Gemmatimonadaceae bacterium]